MTKIASLLFLAGFLLFSFPGRAQTEFIAGYVLLSENDTLFGEIANKGYYLHSQSCDFRRNEGDTIARYLPSQVFGYRFSTGKYYVSRKVRLDDSEVMLFLEFLIKGKLNIYYYQDQNMNPHYFASRDSIPPAELTYQEGIRDLDGKKVFYADKRYMGTLFYLTSDCPAIRNDIENINELQQDKLIRVAKKYHNLVCTDQECVVYNKKIPRKIKFSLVGGHFAYIHDRRFYDPSYSTNRFRPYLEANLLFQQAQRMENIYLGIGVSNNWMEEELENKVRIPLSVNYLSSKQGFSPMITYEFDLARIFSHTLRAGVKYQVKDVSLCLMADLNSFLWIFPYGYSANFGLVFDLN